MLLNESDRPTLQHYKILGVAWAGWLFDFYDLMLFSFLLIPIKASLKLSDGQGSLLLGVSLAATAVGGLVFGWMADRLGRKFVLSATILTYSVGTLCCGFAGNMWMLLVCRAITGLGVGGEWATGQTMVGETFPARMRGRFASVIQTGAPAGIALAAVVGAFLEPSLARLGQTHHLGATFGWRMCFIVSVLPALLVVFIRRHMPESDVWEEWQRHPERRATGDDFLTTLRHDGAIRTVFLLGLVLALTDMSAYWFTYSWMPKYLHDKLGFRMDRLGIWMLVTQAGGIIGYLSFGVVADWKGRRLAYSLYSLVWAIGLFCVTWFWGTIATVPKLTLVFMFLFGLGTGNFSGYGPIFSELFPTRIRNTAMGTAFNLARGVQFFTPLIITWVAHKYSLGTGISIGAFFALATGLWVWTLPETRGTRILPAGLVRAEDQASQPVAP